MLVGWRSCKVARLAALTYHVLAQGVLEIVAFNFAMTVRWHAGHADSVPLDKYTAAKDMRDKAIADHNALLARYRQQAAAGAAAHDEIAAANSAADAARAEAAAAREDAQMKQLALDGALARLQQSGK